MEQFGPWLDFYEEEESGRMAAVGQNHLRKLNMVSGLEDNQ